MPNPSASGSGKGKSGGGKKEGGKSAVKKQAVSGSGGPASTKDASSSSHYFSLQSQRQQLEQLQQLNQQLHREVLHQRQLKQANVAALQALQQNAAQNQAQLAALQANVQQLQALEQHLVAQTNGPITVSMGNRETGTPSSSSNGTNGCATASQIQQMVQQILGQKQLLQQQIKHFKQQVRSYLWNFSTWKLWLEKSSFAWLDSSGGAAVGIHSAEPGGRLCLCVML